MVKKAKKILFICGSPRGKRSSSWQVARYLSRFVEYSYEFINLSKEDISFSLTCQEDNLLNVINKIKASDAVVFVFGVYYFFVPVRLQTLLENLLIREPNLKGKIAASISTNIRIQDDYALDKIRLISEQLGFSYIGDVSSEGSVLYGYVDDIVVEQRCRILAERINWALKNNYNPAHLYLSINKSNLYPFNTCEKIGFKNPATVKNKNKDKNHNILVIVSDSFSGKQTNINIARLIDGYSNNIVEIVDLAGQNIESCQGCYSCVIGEAGDCIMEDDFCAIKKKMDKADGIIYIGVAACGVVDFNLRRFIERTYSILHRPYKKNVYGFCVVSGKGLLNEDGCQYLESVLGSQGICCLGRLSITDGFDSKSENTLIRAVKDLDRAIDEKWRCEERSGIRGIRLIDKEYHVKWGYLIKGNYNYQSKNKMLCRPSKKMGHIMSILFNSNIIRRMILRFLRNRTKRVRERRLRLLSETITLDKGREIK